MAILKDNLTKQVKNIGDFADFKARIEKKYGSKIVDGSSEMGYSHFILANGDKVRYDDDSKLIGNPFHHKKGGGSYSHMTKPHYSEDGYKPKGGKDFDVNWPMSFGAGTKVYAKSIGLSDAEIKQAESAGMGNDDDVRRKLDKFAESKHPTTASGPRWNSLTQEQRLDIMKQEYPADYLLSKPAFVGYASKLWKDLPEGVTKNHLAAILSSESLQVSSVSDGNAVKRKSNPKIDDEFGKPVKSSTTIAVSASDASDAGRELSEYGHQKAKYKVTSHKSNKPKSRRNSTAGIGSVR